MRQIVSFHEECREQAAADHDAEQQARGRARPAQHPLGRPLEEVTDLEIPDDQHEAKQEDEHVQVDRRVGVRQRQHAGHHHRHRAQERGGGSVQMDEREALHGDQQVRRREDREPRRHISQLENSTPAGAWRSG
jgi:hypothetical protein